MPLSARPFSIGVPDPVLARIHARVSEFDWEGFAHSGGWTYGIAYEPLRELCEHWTHTYDWRSEEARLNKLPQFACEIDGQWLHFVHIRSSDNHRVPLLLIHGWPGSYVEFLEAADRLAHPEQHGGRVGEGRDVIIPSLPGFAFSGRPSRPVGPRIIARLFDRLMTQVLGYTRYIAQGGDWGSAIAAWLGYEHKACCAIHLNMIVVRAADSFPLTEDERRAAADDAARFVWERGYSLLQSTRPQTLGVGLHDSPVGVAAWLMEKYVAWSDLPRTPGGEVELRTVWPENRLLTAIMLYLVTGAIVTSTWIYVAHRLEGMGILAPATRIEAPLGFAAFPDPVFVPPPRLIVERSYNVRRWTTPPRGGHFPAFEVPDLYAADVAGFAAEFD